MDYPSQTDVEAALVDELRRRGQPCRPQNLYGILADRFDLSAAQRTAVRPDRGNEFLWNNKVQWARRRLVDDGVMVREPRGLWALVVWQKS
jgi:restriction endonuclease Mrr